MELLSQTTSLQSSGVLAAEELYPELHGWSNSTHLNPNGLPLDGLLAWFQNGVDSIGLSVSDYADVDESIRSIFFVDAETMVDVATAATNALASQLLNTGTMLGTEELGVALYTSDTDLAILRRAYRFFGQPWPYPDDTDNLIDGADVLVDGADNLVDAEA